MFQLYDKTRRRFCIAGFLMLGLLPSLTVAGWCVYRHTSSYLAAEVNQLSRQLGVSVKLSGLKHLRPGVVLYENVELADHETGQPLLQCRLVEVQCTLQPDERGVRHPVVSVVASQPQIHAASIDRTWRWVQRVFETAPNWLNTEVELSAAEVTLKDAERSQTLTGVEALVESLPQGTHAQLQFRLVGADTPDPAQIRLVRNRQVSPPASGFELHTGGGELPCSLLAMGVGELRPLGNRSRFKGYIWANETTAGWEGEAAGQLVDVDLGGLVTNHFPHRMSGIGQITIQSARFRQGRLEEGSGVIVAGPGTIDRSLVESAVDRLGLTAAEEPLNEERIAYDQLAMSATLDAQGLRLRGRCAGVDPGTILARGSARLLGESPGAPQPMAALVRTLVPQSAVQVPASRQSDWLLRHLPVPDVIAPPGAKVIPPTARGLRVLQR